MYIAIDMHEFSCDLPTRSDPEKECEARYSFRRDIPKALDLSKGAVYL